MRGFLFSAAYSNLWIALSAGAQVYVNSWLLGHRVSATAMLLAVLGMFWVYTFAKAVHFDAQADAANDPGRTEFLKTHRKPLILAGISGLALGTVLAWQHSAMTLLVFWSPTFIGLLYDLRLAPATWRYRRLKDVPGLKGVSVASAWTLLILGLCSVYGAGASWATWSFLVSWNFLLWFINTTYFDLGDLAGDVLEGTRTLPVALGFQATRTILHLLNGVAALLLIGAAQYHIVQGSAVVLLVLNLVQWELLRRAKDENVDIGWECDVLFDGVFLLAAVLVWLIGWLG